MNYRLGKNQKLKSFKVIGNLFQGGNSFIAYPFKVVWLYNESDTRFFRFSVSVPKRKYKRAVDRNLIKRKIREAYRLNKAVLQADYHGKLADFMVIYIASADAEYLVFENAMKIALTKLRKKITTLDTGEEIV
ncbi:MAG TPA: ribonuclease P protein component [Bacteroidales bacterium]|nr:ribonuclease P protein component [Bacteroidales bacterium]